MPRELKDTERSLLALGLNLWGGPIAPSDRVIEFLGFKSRDKFEARRNEVVDNLHLGVDPVADDRAWVLLAVELVFISQTEGGAGEWDAVTGLHDEESLSLLRRIQHAWR